MKWLDKLYPYRFVIFIISLTAILFGNLFFPEAFYENYAAPFFLLFNVFAGILLLHHSRKNRNICLALLAAIIITYFDELLGITDYETKNYIRFSMYFLFFALVTIEVITQVWRSTKVDRTVILGVMSGYISLGLLGFFMFMSIEVIVPNSFVGVADGAILDGFREDILYFSYITMLTIGYGDILPTSPIARSATILLGLFGQFYLVIITAIVVGKFLNQNPTKSD